MKTETNIPAPEDKTAPDGALILLPNPVPKERVRNRRIYRGPIFGATPESLIKTNLTWAKAQRESALHSQRLSEKYTAAGDYESHRLYRELAWQSREQARRYYEQAGLLHHILAEQKAKPEMEAAETRAMSGAQGRDRMALFASIYYRRGEFKAGVYSYYEKEPLLEGALVKTIAEAEAQIVAFLDRRNATMESAVAA